MLNSDCKMIGLLLFLSCSQFLMGQISGPAKPKVWLLQNRMIIEDRSFAAVMGSDKSVLVLEPDGRTSKINLPKAANLVHVFQDLIFCSIRSRKASEITLFSSTDGKTWGKTADFDLNECPANDIYSLGANHYLLFSAFPPFGDLKKKWSHFAIGKSSTNSKITFDEIIDLSEGGAPPKFMSDNINTSKSPLAYEVLQIKDGYLLLNKYSGKCVVVRSTEGKVRIKQLSLLPDLDQKESSKIKDRLVLGSYVTPSGDIFFATRTLNGVLGANVKINIPISEKSFKEMDRYWKQWELASLEENPAIVWLAFRDEQGGRIEKLVSNELPNFAFKPSDLKALNFIFNPDGRPMTVNTDSVDRWKGNK